MYIPCVALLTYSHTAGSGEFQIVRTGLTALSSNQNVSRLSNDSDSLVADYRYKYVKPYAILRQQMVGPQQEVV
jgi:hypothetical protein